MEKFRSRKFCLLLYPLEDKSHEEALEYIRLNYDYASIVHDKDLDKEKNIKKSHTHVVISCSNAKWNSALSDELGIPLNYIQNCRSYKNALEYLIHYNDDSKIQYPIENVKGTLKNKLIEIIASDDKSESEKAIELIDFINDYDGYLEEIVFFKYCAMVGMWDVARRSSTIYLRLLDKHNSNFL